MRNGNGHKNGNGHRPSWRHDDLGFVPIQDPLPLYALNPEEEEDEDEVDLIDLLPAAQSIPEAALVPLPVGTPVKATSTAPEKALEPVAVSPAAPQLSKAKPVPAPSLVQRALRFARKRPLAAAAILVAAVWVVRRI